MIWTALGLFCLGLFLSAFFSGAETGMYRVSRVRLVLDGMGGDRIARALLWMTNRPSLFIATTLIGNNVANYVLSLSIVLGVKALVNGENHALELIAPLLFSPLVFVYGELVPKNHFYQAPNRLLRAAGPLIMVSFIVFLLPTLVLWGLSKLLEWIAGQSPQQVQLALTRKELRWALEEGHEAGLLRPCQRQVAAGLLATNRLRVLDFAMPLGRLPRVRLGMSKAEMKRLARRHRAAVLPVEEPLGMRKLIGYIRVAELYLDTSTDVPPVRPLLKIGGRAPHINALATLHAESEPIAGVVDEQGQIVGIVTARRLAEPLFRDAV